MVSQVSVSRPRRSFTPEQKFQIVQDIQSGPTIQAGLDRHQITHGMYHRWKSQLEAGVRAALRNSKPPKDPQIKRYEEENRALKSTVLTLTHVMFPRKSGHVVKHFLQKRQARNFLASDIQAMSECAAGCKTLQSIQKFSSSLLLA